MISQEYESKKLSTPILILLKLHNANVNTVVI